MSQIIKFSKLEAAGNDFILIDNRDNLFHESDRKKILSLCHRRFGIGADGVILVYPHEKFDFEMRYFNSDGSGPVMCGNGARAAIAFAKQCLYFQHSTCRFLAPDGDHRGEITTKGIGLTIKMPTAIIKKEKNIFFIDTGTNHIVIPSQKIDEIKLNEKALSYREKYDSNINYIDQQDDHNWRIRTYERGVEDETYACGTGATAAAYYIHETQSVDYPITMHAKGGALTIFTKKSMLWLHGPANRVFTGQIKL